MARSTVHRPSQGWLTHGAERSRYVREMFGRIAQRYDLINSLMSFRLHYRWRRQAVAMLNLQPGDVSLDACCGTGDFAVELARSSLGGDVIAIDFCEPMITLAVQKFHKSNTHIHVALADALRLPFETASFDCATIGWGLRNVPDVEACLAELSRVLKPGGRLVCLDMAKSRIPLIAQVSTIFLHKGLPWLGALFGKREAYTYLPKSVETFPDREQLADMMRTAGFTHVRHADRALGVVCIHLAVKT